MNVACTMKYEYKKFIATDGMDMMHRNLETNDTAVTLNQWCNDGAKKPRQSVFSATGVDVDAALEGCNPWELTQCTEAGGDCLHEHYSKEKVYSRCGMRRLMDATAGGFDKLEQQRYNVRAGMNIYSASKKLVDKRYSDWQAVKISSESGAVAGIVAGFVGLISTALLAF